MFLPEQTFYATNNLNHVFFLFFISFLEVCFHTILNKSKNIVFHVNFPRCLVCAYQVAVFPLAYVSSIVLDNILQLFISIYIYFSNLNMVTRSSNSCFCLYTEETRLATTPFIRPPLVSPPVVFPPRRENLRVILLF